MDIEAAQIIADSIRYVGARIYWTLVVIAIINVFRK